MKSTLKTLAVIVCVCAFAIGAKAQGYLVPNGVTYLGFSGLSGFETHVLQNPNGNYTGFLLMPESPTSFSFSPFADEGVRIFRVPSRNDPISLEPILANRYPELTHANNYFFPDGAAFYLGFYTGGNPWDSHGNYTGIYMDPVFAWGLFMNNNGTIQMLSSALEYGGGGIYAGTRTIMPVPEPGSGGVFLLGLLCLAARRCTERCRHHRD